MSRRGARTLPGARGGAGLRGMSPPPPGSPACGPPTGGAPPPPLQDFALYLKLFREDLGRNPTNVELFDIAQSNSEHSRHWFFQGALTVDGQPIETTLFKMVKETLKAQPGNSVIGFHDNSSAIRGQTVLALFPENPGAPSKIRPVARDLDLLFTAETHNFPCAVAPYPGAETGAGGRIRDTHATGRGSLVQAATAGYCVGNLRIEGHELPHEAPEFAYPGNLAPPLQILIDASNGASDYGNKFGEPLIAGFCRTFGQRLLNGERREWLKPIMFSAGFGQIDHSHIEKDHAKVGMLVVKLGGPAYRIGLGGGAASSVTSGTNDAELDFNAVQRGDAEMAQKLNRVVRTCVELGAANPILSIHDQGAGGNCNVVKEIIYPGGAEIDIRKIPVGDASLSVMDIWGAEYQENDALLIAPESELLLRSIAERERCPMAVIGAISGSGRVVLVDRFAPPGSPVPEDLELERVLGALPQKAYHLTRAPPTLAPLRLPQGDGPQQALARVFSLVSVGSKRFLTSKARRRRRRPRLLAASGFPLNPAPTRARWTAPSPAWWRGSSAAGRCTYRWRTAASSRRATLACAAAPPPWASSPSRGCSTRPPWRAWPWARR